MSKGWQKSGGKVWQLPQGEILRDIRYLQIWLGEVNVFGALYCRGDQNAKFVGERYAPYLLFQYFTWGGSISRGTIKLIFKYEYRIVLL